MAVMDDGEYEKILVYLDSELLRIERGLPPDDIDRVGVALASIDTLLQQQVGVTNDEGDIAHRLYLIEARGRIRHAREILRRSEGGGE